jgi:hypothetical protein
MQRYISLSDAVVLYGFCFELRNCVFDFQAILGQYPTRHTEIAGNKK